MKTKFWILPVLTLSLFSNAAFADAQCKIRNASDGVELKIADEHKSAEVLKHGIRLKVSYNSEYENYQVYAAKNDGKKDTQEVVYSTLNPSNGFVKVMGVLVVECAYPKVDDTYMPPIGGM